MKTLGHTQYIHLIGIGGIGMSGIAEVLIKQGYSVSGSDIRDSDATRRIAELGGEIFIGHNSVNIQGVDAVVFSSAIASDNPEILKAVEMSIPVVSRGEMLAELMRPKYGIAVAGAHGKTTTTSIMASILTAGDMDPTVLVGGRLDVWGGSNARLGKGDIFVAEADESDGSLMALSPAVAVVTNIDLEHVDYYGNMNEIRSVFINFINKLPFYGAAILCTDNEEVRNMIPDLKKRYITYGITSKAEIHAVNIAEKPFNVEFDVMSNDLLLGRISMALPGRHNVLNALAAIAAGLECGVEMGNIRQGLSELCSPDRRFQVKGEKAGIIVVDDYGHHPTEIEAALETAVTIWPDRRLVAVFQPHRYSRTRDLYDRFVKCFDRADFLILAPVYSAGEALIEGVDSEWLYRGIKGHGHKDVRLCNDIAEIQTLLSEIARAGDIVMTLGAGNIHLAGSGFLERL